MAEHKHATVLRAIADGKAVQFRNAAVGDNWGECQVTHINPIGHHKLEWRVKPEKKKAWINIFKCGPTAVHVSREMADIYSNPTRIACIEIEYEEGQGI